MHRGVRTLGFRFSQAKTNRIGRVLRLQYSKYDVLRKLNEFLFTIRYRGPYRGLLSTLRTVRTVTNTTPSPVIWLSNQGRVTLP